MFNPEKVNYRATEGKNYAYPGYLLVGMDFFFPFTFFPLPPLLRLSEGSQIKSRVAPMSTLVLLLSWSQLDCQLKLVAQIDGM